MHRYTHEKCDFIEFECKLLKLTASFYFLGFQKLKRLSLVILRKKKTQFYQKKT